MFYNGPDKPPELPLPWGDLDPIYYMVPLTHPSQFTKRHLDRFSHFCRTYERYQQTDRQTDRETDHATPSVAIVSVFFYMLTTYYYWRHHCPVWSS